jgi:hypothetical protein
MSESVKLSWDFSSAHLIRPIVQTWGIFITSRKQSCRSLSELHSMPVGLEVFRLGCFYERFSASELEEERLC